MRHSFVPLLLSLLAAACHPAPGDYRGPSLTSVSNAAELSKLKTFYASLAEGPKKTMTAYLLTHLPYEYQLSYTLTGKNGTRIILRDPVSPDSLDAWRSLPGNELRVDTIPDKDIITADLVIRLVTQCDSLRSIAPFKDIPLDEFCEYVLPYRVNNEELFPYQSLFQRRYLPYLSDVLLPHSDTIRNLKSYLDPFFSRLMFPAMNTIDFTSVAGYGNVMRQRNRYTDYEDVMVLNVHALRAIGIPCTYEYIPLQKTKPNGLVRINMFDNEGHSHFNLNGGQQWPYRFAIAKAYRNTFDLTKAINPFTELLKAGIAQKDIPFALNLPRMIDITRERTVVTDLIIPLGDSVRKRKALYLAGAGNGSWKIVCGALVDSGASTVTFRDVGVEMAYQLAGFHQGKMELLGSPFDVDSTGRLSMAKLPREPGYR